jgi:dCMP deaminase
MEVKIPTWKEYFKNIVLETAKRSSCKRLKVGCILVKENRIISQGYNGFLSGHPHISIVIDNHEIATIHAEQNAIIDCAKRGVSCNNSDAYITHFPCINCLKFLIQAGIKNIFYIYDYNNNYNLIDSLEIKINIFKLK